ncbi:uncharacterized protein LOC142335775 isoform X2 [Convolutriloba macropyga]|uniref:uncharacterized protein LOC142335775 isoform X2 n=1 Tax=Convolutriloba macropyga TaxID=536237 RepID=UPI003F52703B
MSIINLHTPCYKEEQTTLPQHSQGTSTAGSSKTKPNLFTPVNLNYLGHLVKLLLFMEALCSVTRYCQAATIEFDWSKHNKVFREATAGGHLVRVHIGDRLHITCSHPHSVIILTDSFQDYHSCQFNHLDQKITKASSSANTPVQSSGDTESSQNSQTTESEAIIRSSSSSSSNNGSREPLWMYNCSKVYGAGMGSYNYKTQLSIYRYPSVVGEPSFQFAQPYFLIDIGVPTPPKKSPSASPTPIPESSNVKNKNLFDLERSLQSRSNTPDDSMIRGKPKSEKLLMSPQYLYRVTSPPSPYDAAHRFLEKDADYMLMDPPVISNSSDQTSSSDQNRQSDKSLPDFSSHDEGDLRARERRKKGQSSSKQRVKGHLHGKTREKISSGASHSWNMCELYQMKLSLFVEFRDDNIGSAHLHLPIHEEIVAENHLTAGSHTANYSSAFYFKLRPQRQLQEPKQNSQSETDPEERKFLKFFQVAHPGDTVPPEQPSNPTDPTTQRSSSASSPSSQGLSPSSSASASTPRTNWGSSHSTADSDFMTFKNHSGSRSAAPSGTPGEDTSGYGTENSRNSSAIQSSEMYNGNTENAGNGNGENSISATSRHENNWLIPSLIILIINYWC